VEEIVIEGEEDGNGRQERMKFSAPPRQEFDHGMRNETKANPFRNADVEQSAKKPAPASRAASCWTLCGMVIE
jgi:hypothetical protein